VKSVKLDRCVGIPICEEKKEQQIIEGKKRKEKKKKEKKGQRKEISEESISQIHARKG